MLDSKQRAAIDQAIASTAEMYPRLLWQLFQGFQSEGFNEQQSLELIKAYMTGLLSQARPQ